MKKKRVRSDRMICISIDMKETGKNIRKKMMQNGYSVEDIMEITGVSTEQAVYKWLGGKSLPSLETLLVMSRIFEVDVSELLVVEKPREAIMATKEYTVDAAVAGRMSAVL